MAERALSAGRRRVPGGGSELVRSRRVCRICGKKSADRASLGARGRASANRQHGVLQLARRFAQGTVPVGTNRRIGLYDVYDLAGNVREWCSHATAADRQSARGGAWDDPRYSFDIIRSMNPMDRSPGNGFRCVRYLDPPAEELLKSLPPSNRDFSLETPATLAEIDAYRRQYVYDQRAPLNAQAVSAVDESPALRHEVIRINAAYGGERFDVHILLPRKSPPPHPTLVYFAGVGVLQYNSFDGIRSESDWAYAARLVESGWAICWPTIRGSFDRNLGPWPPPTSIEFRDRTVLIVKDLSRAVDYLEMRSDIDRNRLGYLGFSWGGVNAPVAIAVEPRYRAGVLLSCGYRQTTVAPEIEPFKFAPFVKIPILLVTGRNDELLNHFLLPEPFLEHLGATDKKWIQMDGDHLVPAEATVQAVIEWLDSRLAPAPGA